MPPRQEQGEDCRCAILHLRREGCHRLRGPKRRLAPNPETLTEMRQKYAVTTTPWPSEPYERRGLCTREHARHDHRTSQARAARGLARAPQPAAARPPRRASGRRWAGTGTLTFLAVGLGLAPAHRIHHRQKIALNRRARGRVVAGARSRSRSGSLEFLRHAAVFASNSCARPGRFVLARIPRRGAAADRIFRSFSESGTPVFVPGI